MGMLRTGIYASMFLLCIGICYIIVFLTNRLPGHHGVIHVERESGNGTIYRLLDGIPHVHADSVEMGYYSLGFAMASDRIFQMDKLRRISQGRLSELFGEPTINVDKAMRNFGFEPTAKEIYQNLDKDTKEAMDNFVDGVNDYLKYFSVGIEYWFLGVDFKPWTPADSISTYLLMMFSLSQGWDIELYREFLSSKIRDQDLVDQILPYELKNQVEFAQTIFTDDELKEFGYWKEDGLKNPGSSKPRKTFEFIENDLDSELKNTDFLKGFSSGEGASN